MQLFKYMTLILCQEQHPDVIVVPPRGKQNHLSKGPIGEDGKKQRM